MNANLASVDEYLSSLPEEQRTALSVVRRIIRAAAPDAVESISYGMPAYKYRGRPLVYFGAAKNHCSLYGIDTEGHEQELAGFSTSGKGTLRFTPAKPLPEALVRTLVVERMTAIEAAAQGAQDPKPRRVTFGVGGSRRGSR